jgi:ABC-type enterobactin transport system permease subunit
LIGNDKQRSISVAHRSRISRALSVILGAAVAIGGAVFARSIAETLPADQRPYVWIAGSTAIFLGLAILSRGVRSRDDGSGGDEPPA